MKTKNKVFLIGLCALICIAGIVTFFLLGRNSGGHVHEWGEWRVTRAPSCDADGLQARSCTCGETEELALPKTEHAWTLACVLEEATCSKEGSESFVCSVCGKEDRRSTAKTEHSFTDCSEVREDNVSYVLSLCEYCGAEADISEGVYFEEREELYLIDRENNFSFDVLCDQGVEHIRQNLRIWNAFYTNLSYDENPEAFEKYTVTNVSGNRYRISPASVYTDNMTYSVALSDGVSFAEYPVKSLAFSIKGENCSVVEYRDDIIFLKQLENASSGYYPYDLSYDDMSATYSLTLCKQGVIDDSYIGRVLCVGDCLSFEEASRFPSNTVVVGKISALSKQGDQFVVTLNAPALTEVYSKLTVNSGIMGMRAESLSAEQKNALAVSLLNSDAFASAIASANLSAQTYASSYGLSARESKISLDNLVFEIKVEGGKYPNGEPNPNQAVATVLVTYKHSVPVEQSGVTLGSVDFNITFDTSVTFTVDLWSNLEDYEWWDWNFKLSFDLRLNQTTKTKFNLSTAVNLQYTYSSEAYYIVNPDSGVIHDADCRMCQSIKNDKACRRTYAELVKNENYRDSECKICKPFSMDESGFVLNLDSSILHCINCESAKRITHDRVLAFSMYPLGYDVENCENCKPQTHTKTLHEYLSESVKSSDWGAMFEKIKTSVGDALKGNGASPIDEDTRPRFVLTITPFEVPIFVEPRFDFDLKADFDFKYESSVTDVYIASLHYNTATNEKGKKIGYEFETRLDRGTPVTNLDLDLTGEARAEIGVIVELRFGLQYISKYFYVGINGEIGAYTELSGVLHASNHTEDYYAARVEAGLYYESALTYAISGLLKPNSMSIMEKTDIPFFNSGDTKAYYAFSDYEQQLVLGGTRQQALPESVLNAVYYDLVSMTVKKENLSWLGNAQYSLSFRFADESGKAVDYCTVENGVLHISDSAPDDFEIMMYVNVADNLVFDNFLDYVTTSNKDGCAFFLDEMAVELVYHAGDAPDLTPSDAYVRVDKEGKPDPDGDYLLFGEYPQTVKAEDVTVTDVTDSRGYYLGSDGEYYAKVTATPYGSNYKFSTGASVTSGSVYYFKVEPIRWRILSESGDTALILCDSIIANKRFDDSSNNYAESEIRAWLNAEFYNTAFSALQRELIDTVTVNNAASTTGDKSDADWMSNPYACANTSDKLFLLSYEEVTSPAYGFASSFSTSDTARRMQTSDYTRATGACSYYGNGDWWLRSPDYRVSSVALARGVNRGGHVRNGNDVNLTIRGAVPALQIFLSEETSADMPAGDTTDTDGDLIPDYMDEVVEDNLDKDNVVDVGDLLDNLDKDNVVDVGDLLQ